MGTIKLQSSDMEIFEVDMRTAKFSQTIKFMLEDCQMENDGGVVPLFNVTAKILRKVLEWIEHHKNDPESSKKSLYKNRVGSKVSSWDKTFLQVDHGTLFELMNAANYMDIGGLLDVTCKTVANKINGRTTEEIRDLFCIENDFTPAEEEQVRLENDWFEDTNKPQ